MILRARLLRVLALLALSIGSYAAAASETLAVLLASSQGHDLYLQDSGDPGGIGAQLVFISGVAAYDSVVAIATRPATGALYALSKNGAVLRLYKVNPVTGAAQKIGADITIPQAAGVAAGTVYSMDFNPVVDRIRVVSDTRDNFRLNPVTGAVVSADTALTSGSVVTGIAYDRNHFGATATTLFGIDSNTDQLVRIGGTDGVPSANGGAVTTIGPMGVDTNGSLTAFEIAPSGTAFAALGTAGTALYKINLSTGAATLVGSFPDPVIDIAAISLRGDANGDGNVDVADVFYLINFLFAGAPPPVP